MTIDFDKKQISLSTEGQLILARIKELEWFHEAQDIVRFCIAYAIKMKVPEGDSSASTETKWAVAALDETGELRELLNTLFPQCKTPGRLMEHFMNEGIKLIGKKIEKPSVSPSDLFI